MMAPELLKCAKTKAREMKMTTKKHNDDNNNYKQASILLVPTELLECVKTKLQPTKTTTM